MAARPRNKERKDWPTGLTRDKNGFLFTRIDGSRVRVGTDEIQAKEVARFYNGIYRSNSLHQKVMNEGIDTFGKFLDKFENEILVERELADSYLTEWKRRLKIVRLHLGPVPPSEIDLREVNKFLDSVASSPRMYNLWRSTLADLFAEAKDKGVMFENPAEAKRKRKEKKKRKRLSKDGFRAIYRESPEWLQVAMDFALQTTHGRYEACHCKLEHYIKFATPKTSKNGTPILGTLKIIRQKTKKYATAWVEIPVGKEIDKIFTRSTASGIPSPFLVHKKPEKITKGYREIREHWTQVAPDYLSRAFKSVRDNCGFFDELEIEERPGFQEIRALAIKLFEDKGFDAQKRAGHSDRKMTEKYKKDHEPEFVQVDFAELVL